jgi:hypothetical protein
VREGDELTLDKGIMVEVAEAMGVTQTDLTPILERKHESPKGTISAPVQRAVPRPAVAASGGLRTASQLRHKSLNTLLGTPKGPIGKAASIRSPFETRKEKENQEAEERASKRQKTAHSPVERRTSTSTTASNHEPQPNKPLPLWAKTSDAKAVFAPPRPLPRPAAAITLDSEPNDISFDVTLPSTPSGMGRPLSHTRACSAAEKAQRPTVAPPITTPRIPKGRVPVPHVKAQETPRPPPEPSSPPISASNRLSNVNFALQPVQRSSPTAEVTVQPVHELPSSLEVEAVPPVQQPPKAPSLPPSPPRKAKSLRLSKGVKRGLLLCQSGLLQKQTLNEPKQTMKPKDAPEQIAKPKDAPKQITKPKDAPKQTTKPNEQRDPEPTHDELVHVISDDEDDHPIRSKPSKSASAQHKKPTCVSRPSPPVNEPSRLSPSPGPSVDSFDDMELVHGLMDQQLMVSPPPPLSGEKTNPVSSTKSVARATPPKKKAPKRGKRAAEASPEKPAQPKKTKTATAKDDAPRPRARKKQAEEPPPARHETPPTPIVLDSTEQHVANEITQPRLPTEKRAGTASVSVSPSKIIALSTGGFRKQCKSAKRKPATMEADIPAPHPVTVVLPPHPLRANRAGPLMTTTELSALLTRSNKSASLEDDPIEESTQQTSPTKSFQRSRSENDAPIPSLSEDWEKRNLPRLSASNTNTGATSANARSDEVPSKPKAGGLAALVKKTDPRRKFQRTRSLNVGTEGIVGVEAGPVSLPPLDLDVGPWSTEAFDLFDWRPPNAGGLEEEGGDCVDDL